jgi:hypothetical protein
MEQKKNKEGLIAASPYGHCSLGRGRPGLATTTKARTVHSWLIGRKGTEQTIIQSADLASYRRNVPAVERPQQRTGWVEDEVVEMMWISHTFMVHYMLASADTSPTRENVVREDVCFNEFGRANIYVRTQLLDR